MAFAFLYTREAHPGELRPAHRTFEDKLVAAQQMASRLGIRRQMLVDALHGPVHRAYGMLPNMCWIVSRAGRVVYKADWTDASTIRAALSHVAYEREVRASGGRLAPYSVEWRPERHNERGPFMKGLAENGPRAVEEFVDAVRATQGEAAVKALWKAH